jgi:polyisoprenoid-binding protein YceI
MTVYVFKQGLFSFLADNHEIAAPISGGAYDAAAKRVELSVAAARLTVLDPKLSPERRAQVQAAMDSKVLDVDRYPTIEFRSTQIDESDPNRWKVTGDLTLHGQTHPIAFAVRREDPSHFSGTATIRQTEFGISPIRVAGGAVTVKDDVQVRFRIALAG